MALARLLNPRSIAFIGGNECAIAITRTRELGFTGKIWAVHPWREELGGIKTVKSVEEIEGAVDAAFIAVKREPTINIIGALSKMGGGGAVIYAAGFAEQGAIDLQDKLLEAANGMPLIGPNCYGFVNGHARVALWPDEHGITVRDTGVAIITQSGNIACNLTFTRRELPLAAIYTIGNQADIDTARMVDALCDDPRITAIGLHIEGLKDVPAFARAAEKARAKKIPIVALKTGKSPQGAKATLSHTSSLSGADQLYDALFDRHGVARVETVSALAETLKFLHHGGPLAGADLVAISSSGGEAALLADMAGGRNVSLPPFDAAAKARIAATLNEFVTIDNPLDYHTFIWDDEAKLTATFTAVLSAKFACGAMILDAPSLPHMNPKAWYKSTRAYIAAAKANNARAVIVASLHENLPAEMMAELAAEGIAPMLGFDDMLTAIEAAALIGARGADPTERPVISEVLLATREPQLLTEYAAKQLLAEFGLVIPFGAICKIAEAGSVASELGFPVVVKTSSSSIAHKTELGGVALNLKTEAEVRIAAGQMAKHGPEVLVEKMVQGVVAELIVGVKRDPQFGLALVIGAGGIFTELLRDSVTLLLPTNRVEIIRALNKLRIWKLVTGFRGKSGDAEAIVKSVEAVASFAAAHQSTLEELDINPLFVLPHGAVAADAMIRMRPT